VARGAVPTNVYRPDLTTGLREDGKEIMPAGQTGITFPPTLLLTPGGRWYVYVIYRHYSDLYVVEGLK
jgi:hypothetical protein